MTSVVFFITEYRLWLYGLIGLLGAFYFYRLWQAHAALGRTPFGLERENARGRRNLALFMLFVLLATGGTISLTGRYVAPALAARPTQDPNAKPTALPTPTPIINSSGPLVIDSSGCENPQVTLTDPQPNTRVSGSYDIRGTANIPNFAFYKLEISGSGTNGLWVPVYVYTATVTNNSLGTFDASAYPAGNYAFRLVVTDSGGGFPPPCVIPITLVSLGGNEPAVDETPTP